MAASHQQIEIPELTAKVIQYDLHEMACARGRVHRAAAPAGAGAPGIATAGIGVQAWCVYLIAAHAIPVHRAAELIEALTAQALARIRALAAGPRRRCGGASEPADPGADHHRVGHLRR
jgi:hypothetical protein